MTFRTLALLLGLGRIFAYLRPPMLALRLLAVIVVSLLLPSIAGAQFDAAQRQFHRVTTPSAARSAKLPTPGSHPLTETYHNGSTLLCSDCHTVHYSESHMLDGTPGQDVPALLSGPNAKLLRRASAAELCLACHDGVVGVPDVVGDDINALSERSAGKFGALDAANFKGHNLARDPIYMGNDYCNRCHWGGMASATVTCIDCHAKHGNNRYRNLQWISWPGGEPPFGIFYRPGSETGLARYEAGNIGYSVSSDGSSSVAPVSICIDCHHAFFSPSYTDNPAAPPPSPYHRHPGTNSEWGAFYRIDRPGAGTDPAHWVAGTGVGFEGPGGPVGRVKFVNQDATDFASATQVRTDNQVFCLSCHKAHGSDSAFSLLWPADTQSQAKDGCQQCHNR